HEARFGLADDPRELRLRPRPLQRAQYRHDVAGIADRRQPQQADAARRLLQGQHGAERAFMSGQKWPLGSEGRRKDLTGGVMLYDASRAGNAAASWFDPGYWKERNEIEGEARGRGTTHFVRNGRQQFVLRHYRRGGLIAKLMGDRYFWRNESTTRAFEEWQLLYHLHRAGLPVPAPIAARYRRQGLM